MDRKGEPKDFKVVEDQRLLRMAVSLSPEPEPHVDWAGIGEGYSVRLATELLSRCGRRGNVIDPFAGTGTTLLAASVLGWEGVGIELMPMGALRFEWLRSWKDVEIGELAGAVEKLKSDDGWCCRDAHIVPYKVAKMLNPVDMGQAIALKTFADSIESFPERSFLQAAGLLAIRDQTRYFEPYLRTARGGRWKTRSEKRPKYDTLENAFGMRLFKMTLRLLDLQERRALLDVDGQTMRSGSALDLLPTMENESFDAAVTSPPYFNGFDYADEYLLDHWFLGLDDELIEIRDEMIPTRYEHDEDRPTDEIEDDAFESYLKLQRDALHEVARVVRPGGDVYYVLDDAMVGLEDVNMGRELMETAMSSGLVPITEFRYSKKREDRPSRLRAERERTAIYLWKKV